MAIITISGTPGSGKSTVAKILSKNLGLKYVYFGEIFRQTAEKHNMTLEEFSRCCEKNKEYDNELDEYQLKILKKGNVIIEGRIAGWLAFLKNISAFKIFIDANIETRVKRIVERENGNIEVRKKEMISREKSEAKRYKNYYNINIKDFSIYDIVIDSSNKSPEEIVNLIIEKMV